MPINKILWKSRKLYRLPGGVGKIVFVGGGLNRYLLEDTNFNLRRINQGFAGKVREIEDRVNGIGKPPICPGEKSVMRGISLPQRLWDKLGEPRSANLARLLEKGG